MELWSIHYLKHGDGWQEAHGNSGGDVDTHSSVKHGSGNFKLWEGQVSWSEVMVKLNGLNTGLFWKKT
ncbi:hypothetical protein AMECASPLE_012792, partial [Ameca splendens]